MQKKIGQIYFFVNYKLYLLVEVLYIFIDCRLIRDKNLRNDSHDAFITTTTFGFI